ncbi:MAG: SDR family NAD(P)-dependent oxidoreductase [Parvularculaceae bacterium]|nr:SDR family NAD(P)-dependent oxidoreductase [Parvularculaceae bacterium]
MSEDGVFNGKVWWITGASSGIGAALAVAMTKAGAGVILSGRNVAGLEAVAARCGTATILPFEATDHAALPGAVERAFAWRGRVDGLVNNAGISQRSFAAETPFNVYEKIIAVDLLAPIALTQLVLPRMIAAGGGWIVAVASVAGLFGPPLRSAYAAAKFGLVGYCDSVRAETAHQGVRVLLVAPGSTRTDVSRNALDATGKARGKSDPVIDNGMDPAMVADQMLAALRAGRRELIVAEGMEAEAVRLRRADPDALFDMTAAMVAAGYAKQLGVQET